LELDAGLTADEVLREAEAEAGRVEREMAVIARQLWGTTFPSEPVPPDDAEGRRALIRRVLAAVARDRSTAETLVDDARGTFAEGWAVYTEQMMLDQGYGGGDPGLRLQQLKFYLRAVVNAILDQSMHAGSMTDAEAMDLLVGRAFQTEGEAVGKIIRAKQTS